MVKPTMLQNMDCNAHTQTLSQSEREREKTHILSRQIVNRHFQIMRFSKIIQPFLTGSIIKRPKIIFNHYHGQLLEKMAALPYAD